MLFISTNTASPLIFNSAMSYSKKLSAEAKKHSVSPGLSETAGQDLPFHRVDFYQYSYKKDYIRTDDVKDLKFPLWDRQQKQWLNLLDSTHK